MKMCPCGTGRRYLECCGLYIQQKQPAPHPEALMRSRYSAFVENKLNYIKKTMKDPALTRSKQKANRGVVKWLGLEVKKVQWESESSDIGFVEFIAKYKGPDGESSIHENSEFHRIEGRWYYIDGVHLSVS